jgi:outer membrane protein assembly factor BamB
MISPPIVAGGIAYIISGDRLYGLNEQNGRDIWEQGPPGVSSFFSGKVANGVLYMDEGSIIMESSTDVRKVYAFDARTGSPLWVSDPGYQMYDLPLTDGLLLAAREHNGVYSVNGLDPRTGKPAWQVPFNCPIEHFGPLLYPQCDAAWTGIVDDTLYLVEHENGVQQATPPRSNTGQSNIYTLKAFDPRTGKLLAQHALDIKSDSPGPIGTSNGLLYFMISIPRQANTITYADYAFDAFRLSDGGHIWHYPLPPFQPPTGQASYPTTSQAILAP